MSDNDDDNSIQNDVQKLIFDNPTECNILQKGEETIFFIAKYNLRI